MSLPSVIYLFLFIYLFIYLFWGGVFFSLTVIRFVKFINMY